MIKRYPSDIAFSRPLSPNNINFGFLLGTKIHGAIQSRYPVIAFIGFWKKQTKFSSQHCHVLYIQLARLRLKNQTNKQTKKKTCSADSTQKHTSCLLLSSNTNTRQHNTWFQQRLRRLLGKGDPDRGSRFGNVTRKLLIQVPKWWPTGGAWWDLAARATSLTGSRVRRSQLRTDVRKDTGWIGTILIASQVKSFVQMYQDFLRCDWSHVQSKPSVIDWGLNVAAVGLIFHLRCFYGDRDCMLTG